MNNHEDDKPLPEMQVRVSNRLWESPLAGRKYRLREADLVLTKNSSPKELLTKQMNYSA